MANGAISAEFQNSNVTILSRHPLVGTLELASSTSDAIEVLLDRASAEALITALALFLMQDDETLPSPPDIGDFSLSAE